MTGMAKRARPYSACDLIDHRVTGVTPDPLVVAHRQMDRVRKTALEKFVEQANRSVRQRAI